MNVFENSRSSGSIVMSGANTLMVATFVATASLTMPSYIPVSLSEVFRNALPEFPHNNAFSDINIRIPNLHSAKDQLMTSPEFHEAIQRSISEDDQLFRSSVNTRASGIVISSGRMPLVVSDDEPLLDDEISFPAIKSVVTTGRVMFTGRAPIQFDVDEESEIA